MNPSDYLFVKSPYHTTGNENEEDRFLASIPLYFSCIFSLNFPIGYRLKAGIQQATKFPTGAVKKKCSKVIVQNIFYLYSKSHIFYQSPGQGCQVGQSRDQ
jgi:hypothetical protein